MRTLLLVALILIGRQAYAKDCFESSARHYGLNVGLLRAISQVESDGVVSRVGINRDPQGRILSRDYGLMQINSSHIPLLVREHRITGSAQLLKDACVNIDMGARILAEHLQRCGRNWACLATYNTGFSTGRDRLRRVYIHRVYLAYQRTVKQRILQ
ncbi:lytic transglycosylase domain-containing protein [Tatumella saanichensis]|uniref:lytic transglycosylase domain-containing protein n=1 Tax=Tatumella saanichensis TaxID=480813 RepID=UPI0004A3A535